MTRRGSDATNGANEALRPAKAALRRRIAAVLARMPAAAQARASAEACSRLARQRVWREANSILFFAPLPGELDIWPLVQNALAEGKTISLPRFDATTGRYAAGRVEDLKGDLRVGRYGIREPVASCPRAALNRLDLLLVPGVAFDPHGRRLGRGKGFYDQLLAAVRGTTCGVAFDEQLVRQVPVGPHDVRLNCILTPTRWIEL